MRKEDSCHSHIVIILCFACKHIHDRKQNSGSYCNQIPDDLAGRQLIQEKKCYSQHNNCYCDYISFSQFSSKEYRKYYKYENRICKLKHNSICCRCQFVGNGEQCCRTSQPYGCKKTVPACLHSSSRTSHIYV